MIGQVVQVFFSYESFFSTVLFAVLFKIWYKLTTGICKSKKRMDGKTVIVTGANAGIGKETARDLARRGARVILACRDKNRGEAAREEIIASTGNKNVILQLLDLSSLASVREFAKKIKETESRLDVLVNNAGVRAMPNKKSNDGLQLTMQINHFGPFLLTILLLDLLKKSAPSRIVMVSSMLHFYSESELDDLNFDNSYSDSKVYNMSKLANILIANELAQKLQGTGVTVNSLHPGVVQTEILRRLPSFYLVPINLFFQMFVKTSVEGAQTSIYLAVSEEVEGVTGKYFSDCKNIAPSKAAQDEGLARKLWDKSEELVKLQPSERLYL